MKMNFSIARLDNFLRKFQDKLCLWPCPSAIPWIPAVAAVFFIIVLGSGLAAYCADRPNVVLILTDDQGYGDVGYTGNTMIQTPNIDQFARQSVRLCDYHVDPTCSPTRSALMTGRYSSRVGVWHTIMGRSQLAADEVTLADLFARAGYRTGIFGKWHLGDNYPFRPEDRGFQESLIHGGGGVGQAPDYWGNDYFDDTYLHNGRWEKQTGYCTDVFFSAAIDFIEANQDRPFFCYLPTNAAHGPYRVDPKYAEPYLQRGVPHPMAEFYGMIANIDENVGRLREHLKKLGLEENTILIFTTDNGTAAGVANRKEGWAGFNASMRGQKGSPYDGGHRVPFFVRWGDHWRPHDVPQLTAHVDVLPTLAELCGLEPPGDRKIDGKSLVPLLREEGDWPERTLVVHSQRIDHPELWRQSSVMTQRWRLVDGRELYDIQADPGQQNNVAESHPELVEQLRGHYLQWWDEISQRFDDYTRAVIGSDRENPTTLFAHDWHGENPPWDQGHAANDNFISNGFWAVQVDRDGTYAVTLLRRPEYVGYPLKAVKARLRVNDQELEKTVEPDATAVTFEIELKAGPARLQTWLDRADGRSGGANYVNVKRLQAAGKSEK